MRDGAQQPVLQVVFGRDLRQRAMQLQKHILQQLLGIAALTGEAQRDAEDARLVRAHQVAEGGDVAAAGAGEAVLADRGIEKLIGRTWP